ncbi:hypothetical protein Cadr_000002865 [Camelus dromedarius]|uniref:Uncharacterized protein n=1 Tax=Camelus dromedarius TaxID=9838 RepID=A0A5N4C1Y5_CAMDR|nr:hypothetical protein Cadr_000002865 [Camelus dromedarius]KAB1252868.1 hypothetical protein Cadr_000002865 [Camelus dromedarius]
MGEEDGHGKKEGLRVRSSQHSARLEKEEEPVQNPRRTGKGGDISTWKNSAVKMKECLRTQERWKTKNSHWMRESQE